MSVEMTMSQGKLPADSINKPPKFETVQRLRADAALRRAERLATTLDQKFKVPGTNFRFGLDPLIGLVPVVGDVTAIALSSYPIIEAARLGLSKRLLARMAANVAIDGLLGAVPLIGDAFDFFFKANRRNLRLLRRHLEPATQR